MNITKMFYTPKEVVEEIKAKYNLDVNVDDIRLACRVNDSNIPIFNFKIDFVLKNKRYYISKKSFEELIKYYSPEEKSARDKAFAERWDKTFRK